MTWRAYIDDAVIGLDCVYEAADNRSEGARQKLKQLADMVIDAVGKWRRIDFGG